MKEIEKLTIRDSVKENDVKAINDIVRSTGYFHEDECELAVELIEERLAKGLKSGYLFNFLEYDGKTIGFTCFGLIPCSKISYDLYWIVIHNDHRNHGYGKYLLKYSEKYIKDQGGIQIYVDTSSKPQYISTRTFYEKSEYLKIAQFDDFYDYDDGKVVYCKKLV